MYSNLLLFGIRFLTHRNAFDIDMDTAQCYCLLSADRQCRAYNLFRLI